ncbi:MAG TPA: rhodanese-like domain-containing protein [Lentimicrobium sp.]|nr:rhodanese-like domain-containing protein [Lentimicrobium sp.]
MKNSIKYIISSLLVGTLLSVSQASPSSVDAKMLAAELKNNKNVILIDVMAADVYAKQHIQGAINIPHKSLYKEGPVEGQFKDAAELATLFGNKGVSNTAKIIIYDDGSQKYNSRVWWILNYLGANEVLLFHKDMAMLEAARIPLTVTPTTLKPVTFEVNLVHDMNIEMASLKSIINNPDIILLDAREKDEYDGLDKAGKSKGHLPNAIFMNFKEVLTENGQYKSVEEIKATATKFGITPEKQVIVYCQTGIKASVLYFAFKELAGLTNVRLYAGAYAEWASVNENPIIK